jgi:hypothetical protein
MIEADVGWVVIEGGDTIRRIAAWLPPTPVALEATHAYAPASAGCTCAIV